MAPATVIHICVITLLFTFLSHTDAQKLRNRDYLKFTLHRKPSSSVEQTLASDLSRISRFHYKQTLTTPLISGASTGSGQYFVHIHIGSPPQRLLLVADTGSDLIWVKCSACRDCSSHLPETSFFPRHSSTFFPLHCYSPTCRLVPPLPLPTICNHTKLHSPCRYDYTYSDQSHSSGFFSGEIATLNTSSGNQLHLQNLLFGCAFNISGPSISGPSFNGAHGVMGLGRGAISFSSQLGHRFGNKFSYCLMDYTISPPPTSYLLIGQAHGPVDNSSRRLRFTPLLNNPLSPTFYYVAIQNISVNGIQLPVDPSVWELDDDGTGGTVVDSGTTLTFLPEPAYRLLLSAFRRRLTLPRVPSSSFDFCVNISRLEKEDDFPLPRLSFNLLGDAEFSPPPSNYFIDTEKNVKCLALQPVSSPSGFSVIGNLMQQGFLFVFDRDESRLGFSRTGCSFT